MKLPAIDINTI